MHEANQGHAKKPNITQFTAPRETERNVRLPHGKQEVSGSNPDVSSSENAGPARRAGPLALSEVVSRQRCCCYFATTCLRGAAAQP